MREFLLALAVACCCPSVSISDKPDDDATPALDIPVACADGELLSCLTCRNSPSLAACQEENQWEVCSMSDPMCEFKVHFDKDAAVKQVFHQCKQREACEAHTDDTGDICGRAEKNSICYECDSLEGYADCKPGPICTPERLGTDTTAFTKHDTAKRYFILDQRSRFEHGGTITKIELEAGSHPPTSDRPWTDDRSLQLVLMHSDNCADPLNTDEPCEFAVDYTYDLGVFPDETFYTLDDLDISVSAGQYFGFSWKEYGIVSFNWGQRPRTGDPTSGRFYRGAKSTPPQGETLTLGWTDYEYWDGHNYRDYAFWVTYC